MSSSTLVHDHGQACLIPHAKPLLHLTLEPCTHWFIAHKMANDSHDCTQSITLPSDPPHFVYSLLTTRFTAEEYSAYHEPSTRRCPACLDVLLLSGNENTAATVWRTRDWASVTMTQISNNPQSVTATLFSQLGLLSMPEPLQQHLPLSYEAMHS